MATRFFQTSGPFGVSGMTGTAGYTVYDTTGVILAPRTTSGVSELNTSGNYVATAALDSSWSGWIEWDDGSGWILDPQPFTNTTAPTSTPAVAPKRRFEFTYTDGNNPIDATAVVFSDPTNAWGARNLDTGAVLTNPALNQPLTRVATGSYFYEIPEVPYDIEWYAKVTAPPSLGGGTQYYYLTSLAPTEGEDYTNVEDVKLELLGETNYSVHADGENNGLQADIDKNGTDSVTESTVEVNVVLLENRIPLPFESPSATVSAAVRRGARKIATGILLNKREKQANPDKQPTAGDALIAEGKDFIQRLATAGALTTETGDDQYIMDAPVAVGATVDANGCDLPDPCPCNYWPAYTVWR